MAKCIDKKIGVLIHGYELGVLEGDELEKFQLHLMECDYCFSQVQDFEDYMRVFQGSDTVKKMIEMWDRDQATRPSFGRRLTQYLWPRTPFFFRPIVPYLLVLIMILPVYFGFRSLIESPSIESLQSIRLTPMRSNSDNVVSLGLDRDVVVAFAVPEGVESYTVIITAEGTDAAIFRRQLTGVNEFNMGELLLPLEKLALGNYRLSVVGQGVTAAADTLYYRFRVRD